MVRKIKSKVARQHFSDVEICEILDGRSPEAAVAYYDREIDKLKVEIEGLRAQPVCNGSYCYKFAAKDSPYLAEAECELASLQSKRDEAQRLLDEQTRIQDLNRQIWDYFCDHVLKWIAIIMAIVCTINGLNDLYQRYNTKQALEEVEAKLPYAYSEYVGKTSHTLTVQYLDAENGNPLAPSYMGTYITGDVYRIVTPMMKGYTPTRYQIEGTMGAEDQEVIVYYYDSAVGVYQPEKPVPHDHPVSEYAHDDLSKFEKFFQSLFRTKSPS